MIWAVLVFLGVPLWLCAVGVLTLVLRSRRLRARHGNVPVRDLRAGHTRWTRGNAMWVSDVFAWRGSPAAWAEDLVRVVEAHGRPATTTEAKALHRLAAAPVVIELTGADGETFTVATSDAHRTDLLGPFAPRLSETAS